MAKARKYRLVNYFDVWGNAKDGWEVNNQCIEFDDLWITDDTTEKEILKYLMDIHFLSTCDRRRVRIDDYAMDVMEIYAVKGHMPLGSLQVVY